jgi:phosphatidylserine decarboxylase
MKLHKEAFPTAFYFIIPLLIFMGITFLLFPFIIFIPIGLAGFVLILLILNFFRNPDIQINENPNYILAPCDGKVVVIEQVFEPNYFKKNMMQVSIFMSPLNVHVNRTPISGKIVHFEYKPGKYLVAFHPKSSEENEQTFFVVKNEKLEVGFKQIAGAVARRIKWYVQLNEEVKQGQEFGFIKFGSRMDIFFSLEAKVKVQLNQETIGGKTVLAEII